LGEEAIVITFEQARQIAVANLSGEYPPEADFEVKPYGLENSEEYQLIWSVNDKFTAPSNGPYPIVNKTTGAFRDASGTPYVIPDAVEVGNWPPPPEVVDEPFDPETVPTLEELEEA
jgi:hypothetical protein